MVADITKIGLFTACYVFHIYISVLNSLLRLTCSVARSSVEKFANKSKILFLVTISDLGRTTKVFLGKIAKVLMPAVQFHLRVLIFSFHQESVKTRILWLCICAPFQQNA